MALSLFDNMRNNSNFSDGVTMIMMDNNNNSNSTNNSKQLILTKGN